MITEQSIPFQASTIPSINLLQSILFLLHSRSVMILVLPKSYIEYYGYSTHALGINALNLLTCTLSA